MSNQYSFDYACRIGDEQVLIKLFETKEVQTLDIESGYIHACEKGHLKVIKFLFEQAEQQNKRAKKLANLIFGDNLSSKTLKKQLNIFDGFGVSCEAGHLDSVKYFIALGTLEKTEIFSGLKFAIQNGKIEIYKYLTSLYDFEDNLTKESHKHNSVELFNDSYEYTFLKAAESGYTEMIQALMDNATFSRYSPVILEDSYERICRAGMLDMLKLLSQEPGIEEVINIPLDKNIGFKAACKVNKENIIHYFLIEKRMEADIHLKNWLEKYKPYYPHYEQIIEMIDIININNKLTEELSINAPFETPKRRKI